MKTMTLTIKNTTTSRVIIGKNLGDLLGSTLKNAEYSKILIITDQVVFHFWAKALKEILEKNLNQVSLQVIPSGEQAKDSNVVKDCIERLLLDGFDRKSVVVAIGGGAVSDVGGFVASIFHRGIDWVVYPTTLLSQVDAAIGGKTGINMFGIKNVVGTFHQPRVVFIDSNCLTTLSKREFSSGVAEIIKYGLIYDPQIISILEGKLIDPNSKELESLVCRSVKIKLDLVKSDAQDTKGKRAILNFGHTMGHAIESVASGRYTHGEAISIGMVFATKLSLHLGLCKNELLTRLESLFKKYNLPTSVVDLDKRELLEKILFDKKTIHNRTKWVLIKYLGKALPNKIVPYQTVEKLL